jgi:diguanylate cyclase (GGDEF)-like protein
MSKKRPPHSHPGSPPPLRLTPADEEAITAEDIAEIERVRPDLAAFLRHMGEARLKAEIAAETDSLTGIANRRGIHQDFADRVFAYKARPKTTQRVSLRDPKKGEHISVAFVDTNDFGLINKELSNTAGNKAIISVADYFRKNLRPDDFVGRLGGDEFIVMLKCPAVEAERVMTKLRTHFETAVTRQFKQEIESLPGNLEVSTLQAAIADKHSNPRLKKKPFELSFSYGIHEMSEGEIEKINHRDDTSIINACDTLCDAADAYMREEKDRYHHKMETWAPPTPKRPGRTQTPRKR